MVIIYVRRDGVWVGLLSCFAGGNTCSEAKASVRKYSGMVIKGALFGLSPAILWHLRGIIIREIIDYPRDKYMTKYYCT